MDASSLRDSAAIVEHINKSTTQILGRFMTLIGLINVESQGSSAKTNENNDEIEEDDDDEETNGGKKRKGSDRTQAAVNAVRIEVEREGLIRAVQDLLTLSRHMKELWVFGELDTLGNNSETQEKLRQTEGNARAVLEGLKSLTGQQGGGESNGVGVDTQESEA